MATRGGRSCRAARSRPRRTSAHTWLGWLAVVNGRQAAGAGLPQADPIAADEQAMHGPEVDATTVARRGRSGRARPGGLRAYPIGVAPGQERRARGPRRPGTN